MIAWRQSLGGRIGRAIILSAALAFALTACGKPFVDSRREAGSTATVGASTPDRPVICYAKGETTPEQVRALAAEVCAATDRLPRFEGESLGTCRLMQPWRATFSCVAPGPARPEPGATAGSPALVPDDPWSGAIYPGGALPNPPRL